MGRKKTEFYKNQNEVWQEELDDIERVKKSAVKNLNKDAIEKDRELIINNLMELNDILESHRIRKINKADVPRGKNILQSLVYLILNDKFYADILSIRKKLAILAEGFESERQYRQWAAEYTKKNSLNFEEKKFHQKILKAGKVRFSKYVLCADGFNRAYEEMKYLVNKYGLANARDESNLATILMYFLTRKLKFEKFFQVIIPMIAERKDESLTAGFDVDAKELPNSHTSFYKCEWKVRLYPFTNITGFKKLLKNYFEREQIHEKNKKLYDEQWVKLQLGKLKINKKAPDKRVLIFFRIYDSRRLFYALANP